MTKKKKILIFCSYLLAYSPSGPILFIGAIPAYILNQIVIKSMRPIYAWIYGFLWPLTIIHYGIMKLIGRSPNENFIDDIAEGLKVMLPQICKSCRQDVTAGLKKCPHCGSNDLAKKA